MFIEYEICKKRYMEAQRRYTELLDEREALFTMTQPNAIRYDTDKVLNGSPVNTIELYMEKKEILRLDERIDEAKTILDGWKEYLDRIEKDLRKSKDIKDRIYVAKLIDKKRVRVIRREVFYSEAQIYRILDGIYKEIEKL